MSSVNLQRSSSAAAAAYMTDATSPLPDKEALWKALKQGVESDDLANVKTALQQGADPNDCGDAGESLVHLACTKGNLGILSALLDHGGSVDEQSPCHHYTPLDRACVHGHAPIVAELIKRGADVNKTSGRCAIELCTPLQMAVMFQQLDCCKLLIDAKAEINVSNYKATPLSEACDKGNYELVKLLLDSGADPNLSGSNPLYKAVHNAKIVALLLERRARFDIGNPISSSFMSGAQAIHQAAFCGYPDSLELLLKAGANPNAKDGNQKTPLDLAKSTLQSDRTNPCNPPDITAQRIADVEKVIALLEKWGARGRVDFKIEDISNKWSLAERLSGDAKITVEALHLVFIGAMGELEKFANVSFDPQLQDRVWTKVSKEHLRSLKETLVSTICDTTLGGFKEAEITAMLKEHRETGHIKETKYSVPLQLAHHFNESLVRDAVVKKVKSISAIWIPDIVTALKEEGVKLPS